MATEYVQDFAFRQVSKAIMATANAGGASMGSDPNGGGDSIFDVVRRKLGKVQDVIQGMAAPLKRRSLIFDDPVESSWPSALPEVIEMSHLVQRGEGHSFQPCQLSNPTWCDYCGDFIWGLYKQCMRCQTCQYTCHQHCVPAVNLNCKSIQDDSAAVVSPAAPVAAASPGVPPLGRNGNNQPRLEPSRSLGQLSSRPGVATRLSPPGPNQISRDGTLGAAAAGADGRLGGSIQHHPLLQNEGSSLSSTSPSSSSTTHQHAPHLKNMSRSASEGYVSPNVAKNSLNNDFAQPQHLQAPAGQNALRESSRVGATHQHIFEPSASSHFLPVSPGGRRSSSPACSPAPRRPDTPPPPPGSVPVNPPMVQAQQPEAEGGVRGETSISEAATEKDETDSGYRSGTIPDDKLPPVPSQATLDRQELKRKIAKYNHFVPAASFEAMDKEAYQGFVKVTMNLIRPITMELGARPPSIYELLTREHIVEENTQHVAFYMPRDTHKSLHITSDTTTKEVVTSLLKKFHILDHPRKFAMYDQEFNDKNKLVRLRRLNDKDFPLRAILDWDPERIRNYRLVLQENETGEIVWDAFSLPELNNFLRVLDREEKETILELKHKYAYMRQYMERRLAELRGERRKSKA